MNAQTKTARPLGHYVAVEPSGQGSELVEANGILLSVETRTHRDFLSGEVLACGSSVTEVGVGDVVVYERQSGHPSQTGPIKSSVFGGRDDRYCVLIPVYRKALQSSADLEERLVRHQKEVEALSVKAEAGWLERLDVEKLGFHERAISELSELRRGRGRSGEHRKKGDTAIGAGVIGIIRVSDVSEQ